MNECHVDWPPEERNMTRITYAEIATMMDMSVVLSETQTTLRTSGRAIYKKLSLARSDV